MSFLIGECRSSSFGLLLTSDFIESFKMKTFSGNGGLMLCFVSLVVAGLLQLPLMSDVSAAGLGCNYDLNQVNCSSSANTSCSQNCNTVTDTTPCTPTMNVYTNVQNLFGYSTTQDNQGSSGLPVGGDSVSCFNQYSCISTENDFTGCSYIPGTGITACVTDDPLTDCQGCIQGTTSTWGSFVSYTPSACSGS